MQNHRSGVQRFEEAREAIRVAEQFGKLMPRHGWNTLNVMAGLYWHLDRLDEALMVSDSANAYFDGGEARIKRYAMDQRDQKGTEFIIFATARARLLYEKGIIDKKNRKKLHAECIKLGQELLSPRPNVVGLGRIERARQHILAEIAEMQGRKLVPFCRTAYAGTIAVKPTSHVLYGAMPVRTVAIDRLKKWNC